MSGRLDAAALARPAARSADSCDVRAGRADDSCLEGVGVFCLVGLCVADVVGVLAAGESGLEAFFLVGVAGFPGVFPLLALFEVLLEVISSSFALSSTVNGCRGSVTGFAAGATDAVAAILPLLRRLASFACRSCSCICANCKSSLPTSDGVTDATVSPLQVCVGASPTDDVMFWLTSVRSA